MKKKLRFEVDKIQLQFDCTHGVYLGNGSFCYCTDITRANIIAYALNKLGDKELKNCIKHPLDFQKIKEGEKIKETKQSDLSDDKDSSIHRKPPSGYGWQEYDDGSEPSDNNIFRHD